MFLYYIMLLLCLLSITIIEPEQITNFSFSSTHTNIQINGFTSPLLQLSPTWVGVCLLMPLYCFSIIIIFHSGQIDNQSYNLKELMPTLKYNFYISISFCLRYMHILLFFSINLIRIKLLPSAQSKKLKPNILAWTHVFMFVFSLLIVLECFYLPFTQLIILRTKNCAQIRN